MKVTTSTKELTKKAIFKLFDIVIIRNYCIKKALNGNLKSNGESTLLLRLLVEKMNNNPHIIKILESEFGEKFQELFWQSDIGHQWHLNIESSQLQEEYLELIVTYFKAVKVETVLDVGCGWGTLSFKLAKLNPNTSIKAIDISDTAIKVANEKYQLPNLSFEVFDFEQIEDSFDFFMMVCAIDYVLPKNIHQFVEKVVTQSKRALIITSLRNVPFKDFMLLEKSLNIKRYDSGYVHPFNDLLSKLSKKHNFAFAIEKCGNDSALIKIDRPS